MYLIGAQNSGSVGGFGNIGQEELCACHLQGRANSGDPAPDEKLLEVTRHATPNHACTKASFASVLHMDAKVLYSQLCAQESLISMCFGLTHGRNIEVKEENSAYSTPPEPFSA